MANQKDVHLHVTVLGWLFIAANIVFVVIGWFVFTLLTGLGMTVRDAEARAVLPVIGSSVGTLLMLLAVPGLLAGYGLIARKQWGRVLALVVGILGLLNFPFGTALGVYALWVLLPTRTAEYFAAAAVQPATPPIAPGMPPEATPPPVEPEPVGASSSRY